VIFPVTERARRAGAWGLLLLLIAAHVGFNFLWIERDQSYPKGDEPQYLSKSYAIYRALASPGPETVREILFARPLHRLPLFALPAVAVYAVSSPGYDRACLSNGFYFALLLAAVYLTGTRLEGRKAGLLAAWTVSFYPFFNDYSRKYWSEIGIAAWFALTFFILLRSGFFRRRGDSALLGLVGGAGVLIKQFYAFYFLAVVGPLAGAVWLREFARLRRGGLGRVRSFLEPTSRRSHLLACAGLVLILGLPYYLVHGRELRVVFDYGEITGYWTPVASRWSLPFWTWYLEAVRGLIGWFLSGAFLAALAVLLARFRVRYLPLLVWILGGYLAVSWFEAKLPRYASALLPALALVTAVGIVRIPRRSWRRAAIGLLAAGQVAGFLWSSWGIRLAPAPAWLRGELTDERFYESMFYWDKPPERAGDWRVEEILAAVERNASGRNVKVMVVPYLKNFFPETFAAAAAGRGLDYKFDGPGSPFRGFNFRFLLDADYIVSKDGETTRDDLERLEYVAPAAELVAAPPPAFAARHELMGVFPLPDGTDARLYRRCAPLAPEEQAETVRAVLAVDPDHVWAWNALGEALVEAGDGAGAREAFAEVVRLDPEWTGGYLGLGRAELEAGNLEEARRWIDSSLERTPEWPYARFVLGLLLEREGKPAEAAREFRFARDQGKWGLPEKAEAALRRMGYAD